MHETVRKCMLIILFYYLQAKRSDLDMNHHVNNVKYVGWMLEVKKKNIKRV